MAPMLFYLIVEKAVTALALQLDVFLDSEQVLHHSIDLDAPLERVELCVQYFVLLSLLE